MPQADDRGPCLAEVIAALSLATDLGMAPMLHTGFEHIRLDPGWANVSSDVTFLRQFGGSHRHVAPMTLLYSMIYSGVF